MFAITFCKQMLMAAREVNVVQLELLDRTIRKEYVGVPLNATTKAEVIDLMARILVAILRAEGERDDRSLVQFQILLLHDGNIHGCGQACDCVSLNSGCSARSYATPFAGDLRAVWRVEVPPTPVPIVIVRRSHASRFGGCFGNGPRRFARQGPTGSSTGSRSILVNMGRPTPVRSDAGYAVNR